MKKKLIVLTVVVLFGVLILSVVLGKSIVQADDEKNGSTIAGISVSGLSEDEVRTKLQKAIQTWKKEEIVISGAGKQVVVDASEIQFDIDATLTQYEETTDTSWFAFWEDKPVVHQPLQVTIPENIKESILNISSWKGEETFSKLEGQASYLKNHEIDAVEVDYSTVENERIALSIEEVPENVNIQEVETIVGRFSKQIVHPNETFSLIETIDSNLDTSKNDALNFVASVLYDAVLKTDLTIVERHAQNEKPKYLQPGINASINLVENLDLKFSNLNNNEILLKASVEKDSLKIEFYANENVKEVSVNVKQEDVDPKVIYRYSPTLAIGEEILIQEGEKGKRVIVTRTISESGNTIEEQISRDYYPPTNRIVKRSSLILVSTTSESTNSKSSNDSDTNMDLDGNGLPDVDPETTKNADGKADLIELEDADLPEGSYYDKAGNLVIPSSVELKNFDIPEGSYYDDKGNLIIPKKLKTPEKGEGKIETPGKGDKK